MIGTLINAAALIIAIVIAGPVLHHTYRTPESLNKAQPSTSSQLDRAPAIEAPPAPAANAADLSASFVALEQSMNADIGLTVGPVGATGNVQTFGSWATGPAWSTSKVPLVIAAMRQENLSTPSVAMQAAITESDNQAAEQIWESLGDPTAAAHEVEEVLRQTGDPTMVESRRIRQQYTAFGQTIWSLTNQEHFLSQAACDARNTPVLQMMSHIESDQRWGLGKIDDAKFKGGWGPSTEERYLVRQLGLIPTPHGTLTVAVAAEPASGSFDDGITALNAIAKWISLHLQQLPAGTCPATEHHS